MHDVLAELSAPHVPPCLSLFQPTHRTHPENRQDPIRFRNLMKALETSLRETYPTAEAEAMLVPFEALASDTDFWNHTLDGLAVFGSEGTFQVLRLAQPVAELVVVADSFHTKPLRHYLQSLGRYQVLALSLGAMRMYEGNQLALDELELLAGVPRTLEDALGDELTEPFLNVGSHGGSGGEHNPMHHGQGGKADEAPNDADRFFRAVDRAVMDHYSKPSGLPLILAALPEHHLRFHAVSRNPRLVAEGIRANPDAMSTDELRDLAWKALEPGYKVHLAALCEDYAHAESKGHGSDVMTDVAVAASNGRVATLLIAASPTRHAPQGLLVAADRQIPGRIDAATGHVRLAQPTDLHVDDLLDDLSALVTAQGGKVMVIPPAEMPSTTGLAATYRY